MNKFHNEEDHTPCFALLFDSHDDVERRFKEKTSNYPYTVIKDKEEKRISAMLDSAGQIGSNFVSLQKSAISAIAMANNQDEAMMMSLGIMPMVPSGVSICSTCLARAILTCQEQLEILKDLQEAVKGYVR